MLITTQPTSREPIIAKKQFAIFEHLRRDGVLGNLQIF